MSIRFDHVSYVYGPHTPFEYQALKDVSFTWETGKIHALIGATGSGKSTLVQHLNALLLPTTGIVEIAGMSIHAGDHPKALKQLRKQVGLVFQFPEAQLFEETIGQDIAFGPKNFGMQGEALDHQIEQSLSMVGLDLAYKEQSPLDLSGGQKRRVAIAGILAMNPDILVLDEPTAGLDPQGSRKMMELFVRLNKEAGKTIILVTHDMEHVLNYCDDVLVLDHGSVVTQQDARAFFREAALLDQLGIVAPQLVRTKEALKKKGIAFDELAADLETLAASIGKGSNNE